MDSAAITHILHFHQFKLRPFAEFTKILVAKEREVQYLLIVPSFDKKKKKRFWKRCSTGIMLFQTLGKISSEKGRDDYSEKKKKKKKQKAEDSMLL